MAQGDVPTSLGGPLRRRREKRQLERLAGEAARRKSNPSSAHRHVSVIENETTLKDGEADAQAPDARPEPMGDIRPQGFHVRPVPIDQPIDQVP
jgi:hypothetical protein